MVLQNAAGSLALRLASTGEDRHPSPPLLLRITSYNYYWNGGQPRFPVSSGNQFLLPAHGHSTQPNCQGLHTITQPRPQGATTSHKGATGHQGITGYERATSQQEATSHKGAQSQPDFINSIKLN